MQPNYIFVNAQFPPTLERQARIEAARRGVSRSELVRLAVEKFLAESSRITATEVSNDKRS